MRIGGENDPDAVQKRHWELFAEAAGVKPRLVLTRIAEIAQRVNTVRVKLLKETFAPYACDALYRLAHLIGEQTERTVRRIS